MISEDINEIHNGMVMSKLSDAPNVVALRNDRNEIKTRYVIIKGVPFEYRAFMFMITAILRTEPHHTYAEHITDTINELWQTVDYKFVPKEPVTTSKRFGGWKPQQVDIPEAHKITQFVRDLICEAAKEISGMEDDPYVKSVDYKPLMVVVYQLLQDC